MSKMIRFEFDKLFRRKSFYIIGGIAVGLVLFFGITNAIISSDTMTPGWQSAAEITGSSQIVLLAGIFTALFVCSENEEGTLKNIYSRGFGREMVYISTYIATIIGLLIMHICTVVAGFALGTFFKGVGNAGNYPASIAAQLVVLCGYFTLFYAVSVIIGKNGFAIATNVLSSMIVALLLLPVDNLLSGSDVKVSKFWISSVLDKAVQAPGIGKLGLCAALGAVYAVVFFVLGYVINKKKQI